jgi:hypothetical protein
MADITTDLPRWCAPTTSYRLKVCQWLLLAVLACCGCWVAVDQAAANA